MGCTTVQGYFLSRPMSVAAVDSALANQYAGNAGDSKIPKFVGVSDDGRLVEDMVA
jgi:hypothetical protein